METQPFLILNNNTRLNGKKQINNNETYLTINKRINNILLNISYDYILKDLFLHLKYNYILKLIKYNKSLQNKLGINIEKYKDYSDYKYIIKKEVIETKNIFSSFICDICREFRKSFWTTISFIYSLFIIIYIIISNKFRIKLNNVFDKFIYLTNKSLLYLIIFIIISLCIIKKYIGHYDKMTKYHLNLILFFIFIYILYEILIILKIFILIINIKSAFNWRYTFILFDIIFLILNLLWIKMNYKENYVFFKNNIENLYNYYLIRYKNIPIKEYFLFNDFKNYTNKIEYIRNLANKFNYLYSDEDLNVISLINNFRIRNDLDELEVKSNLPRCIIDEPTKFIFYDNENIFKLSNNKYLLKYKIGLFNIDFHKNNKEIMNILLISNLNTINIITQGKTQYILLYDKEFEDEEKKYICIIF